MSGKKFMDKENVAEMERQAGEKFDAISDEERDRKILAVSSADVDKILSNPKLKTLSNRLHDVAQKFDAIKRSGLDEEILVIFICDRTKLSKRDVKEMLKAQAEFFAKLMRRNI